MVALAIGLCWQDLTTGSEARAALGSPRDGKSCKPGHAFVAEMGVNRLTSGDTSLIKVFKPKVISYAAEDGSTPTKLRIGGKRLNSRIVLCHGTYRFSTIAKNGDSTTGPSRRFKVGPARGHATIEEEGYMTVRICARLKR